jgi:hypothetical protein
MVFNTTFNSISVIMAVSFIDGGYRVPGENPDMNSRLLLCIMKKKQKKQQVIMVHYFGQHAISMPSTTLRLAPTCKFEGLDSCLSTTFIFLRCWVSFASRIFSAQALLQVFKAMSDVTARIAVNSVKCRRILHIKEMSFKNKSTENKLKQLST